jgi:hypothetical protein
VSEEAILKDSSRNLPFLQLATKGSGALLRNFFPFLQMAIIPILLFMLCLLIALHYAPRNLAPLLVVLSDRTMTTIFGMAWLGYLLMPEEGRRYWMPRWSKQHSLFLLYNLCISAVIVLQNEILQSLRPARGYALAFELPLTVLVNLPADTLHAAIGLAFCALAVNQRGGPIWSARLVGWGALKIVVIVTLFSACFTTIGNLVGRIIGSFGGSLNAFGLLSAFPANVASYAAYAVVLGVLAFAYRHLTAWQGIRREVLERFD